MKRSLLVTSFAILCACSQHRIGQVSAREHANAGRPHEAFAAYQRDEPSSPYRALQEGMFLHLAGSFEKSEAAWSGVKDAQALLHPVELKALERMRAFNVAALKQDAAVVTAALAGSKFEAKPLAANEAAILVIIERGWAPVPVASSDPSNPSGDPIVSVTSGPTPPRDVVRLDDQEPLEVPLLIDDSAAWSSATLERFEKKRAALSSPTAVFDLSRAVATARNASDVWWSAPTQLSVAQVVTTPGTHVLLLPTPSGLRERRIDLAAGQLFIVVTHS